MESLHDSPICFPQPVIISVSVLSARTVAVLKPLAILIAAFALFVLIDRRLAFLEDETIDVTAAQKPVLEIARSFTAGHDRLEHPPLAEVLLHYWLPVAGIHPRLLRLPAMLLYFAGVTLYACVARRFAGRRAFYAMLWIGALWPFGLHFGRLIGWYCLSFFLVAAVTLAYLRYIETQNWPRGIALVVVSVLLLYSNYFGWAIVGCLVVDFIVTNRSRRAVRSAQAFLFTLALLYVPVWRAFIEEFRQHAGLDWQAFGSRSIQAGYSLYSVFVSESLAPWFWAFSVPVSAAIVLLLYSLLTAKSDLSRRFIVYFVALFIIMSGLGIITTKRLLLISGWLLLPIAVSLVRRAIVIPAIFIAAMGWMGFLAQKYYAAPHFIEPWSRIAGQAAAAIKSGDIVISDSPAFLFELNYALERSGLASPGVPRYADHPRVIGIDRWRDGMLPQPATVFFVKGVNINFTEETAGLERRLKSLCAQTSDVELLPDSGFALKSWWFPESGQLPFRISVQTYGCRGL